MDLPDGLKWKKVGPELGKGGQGSVFVVKEQGGEKKYAMKVIESHRPAQALQRFHREVEAIKRLDHPCIVKLVDAAKPGEKFQYYVMEYVEDAKSLKQLMETGKNLFKGNPTFALGLFISLLEVIKECSIKGVIHRDLSPGNVLISGFLNVSVIDFGLCQIADGETITLTDEGLGTRHYSAPEVEAGSEGEISWKSDLYSAAKIMWSAISGQLAFARESPAFRHKSMKALFPNKPQAWHLRELFLHSIRHDPKERFESIDEALVFARRLEFVMNSGFPALEMLIEGWCPTCGMGKLIDAPQGHQVFGNPNPAGVASLMCSRCGLYLARSYTVLRKNIGEDETIS